MNELLRKLGYRAGVGLDSQAGRQKIMNNVWLSCLVLILLSGCSRTANLMPSNYTATQSGPLAMNFQSYGMGTGEVSMTLASGDVLTGRYQLDRQQNLLTSSTTLLVSVYGKGKVQDIANQMINGTPVWSPGTVDVSSNSGMTGHCELMNNNNTGHGQGACGLANGAIYVMQY